MESYKVYISLFGANEELDATCFLFWAAAVFFPFHARVRGVSSSPSLASLGLAVAPSFFASLRPIVRPNFFLFNLMKGLLANIISTGTTPKRLLSELWVTLHMH